MIHYVKKGQTITGDYYSQVLQPVEERKSTATNFKLQ